MTLHRAREAVRDGDLEEAARLLAGLDSVAALDLLARVQAQRDEFAEADRCWARVQELDDNAAAAAGRRTVARILAGRRLARPLITAGRATAVVSTAVFLLAGGVAWVVVTAPPRAAAR
ncbi:hypothetical protein KUTG_07362 [Kutzneria sp. 744]|nr:hypothetical protein KUTG_07362 [Kutzneria sp. 744]